MRRLAKTKGWSLSLLVMSLALVLVPVAGAQSNGDPAALLASFEKVAFGSSQDIENALALFSDTAVLTVMPAPAGTSGVWTGKDEIRKGLLFNKQLNVARVNTGTPRVEGNKVSTNAKVTNNYFQMLGLGAVDHTTEVVVEGGKIKAYSSTMVAAEQPRVAAAAKAYQAAHPVQQPANVPNTGIGDQQTTQSFSVIPGISLELTLGLVGLLAAGVLSLGALFFVRSHTTRQLK